MIFQGGDYDYESGDWDMLEIAPVNSNKIIAYHKEDGDVYVTIDVCMRVKANYDEMVERFGPLKVLYIAREYTGDHTRAIDTIIKCIIRLESVSAAVHFRLAI